MFFNSEKDGDKNIVGPTEFLSERLGIVYISDLIVAPFGDTLITAPYYLLARNEKNPDKTIRLLIDSGGGYLQSFLFVYDVMTEEIKAPVYTLALGRCYSAAVLLFIAGKKGKRFCLPHTEFILHFPSKVSRVEDKTIPLEEILRRQSTPGPEKPREGDGNVLCVPRDEWETMKAPEKIPVKTGEDISRRVIKNILRTHLKSDKVEDVIKRLEESEDGKLNIYSEEAVEIGIADKILTKKNRDEFFS